MQPIVFPVNPITGCDIVAFMLPRNLLAVGILLLAAAGVSLHAQAPQPGPLVIGGLGQATAPLDGPWQFHLGDDLAWAAPSYDDSRWEQIQTGQDWEHQGHSYYFGYAWYRRQIKLPAGAHFDLALYLPHVQDSAEIYWKGRLVGQIGKLPPNAVWYSGPNPSLGLIPLGPASSGTLAIRVWKAPYAYLSSFGEGGLVTVPQLASLASAQLLRRNAQLEWLRKNLAQIFVAIFAALISLAAWIVWFRDRSNWMLFWLALFMLRPLAFLADLAAFVPWRISYGLEGIVYSSFDAFLWYLLLYLLNLRSHQWILRWTALLACFSVATQVFEGSLQLFEWQTAPHFFLLADVGLTVPSLITQIWGIVLVLFAVRQQLDLSRWLLVFSALCMDSMDDFGAWVALGQRWTHWHLAEHLGQPLFRAFGGEVNITTFFATLLLVAVPLVAWRQTTEQRRRAAALEQEFQSASEIQRVLIPASLPSVAGFSITSAYLPAREVGGDFFQIIPLAEGGVLIVIGDVSGKGLGAAMNVAVIVGALNTIAEKVVGPAVLLAALNRRLCGRLQGGFATCLVLRVDANGVCTAANAGHLAPYVDGAEMELENGLPLGLAAEADYPETCVALKSGARITLMTDGVVEARDKTGALFGFERTAALSNKPAEVIAQAAETFGQEDDITVLTLVRDS
jgi:Stage II sporulation protein E (SpoIIE)